MCIYSDALRNFMGLMLFELILLLQLILQVINHFSVVFLYFHTLFILKPDEFGHEIKISSYVNKIDF